MLRTRRAVAALLTLAVLLAGCTGAPGVAGPREDTTTTPPTTTPPTTTPPTTTPGHAPGGAVSEAVVVFDHAGLGGPVVEGGLTYAPENTTVRRTAVLVGDPADRSLFNHTLLERTSPDAATLVSETDLSNASLLVFQVTPASSVPDYRVENVTRADGTVTVSLNDSSDAGTADITVETVIVRVAGPDPERVVFRTEENVTVTADAAAGTGAGAK